MYLNVDFSESVFDISVFRHLFNKTVEREDLYSLTLHQCLISNREGPGTSLQIMGLATIDPHSQKEHTEIHKIPMVGVNQARFDRDTPI